MRLRTPGISTAPLGTNQQKMNVVRKQLNLIVYISFLLGITLLIFDFFNTRLTFPVFSNRKRYSIIIMPTREEVLQIETEVYFHKIWMYYIVQIEPARIYWQKCRLVLVRIKGKRSAFSRKYGTSLLFYLFCPRFVMATIYNRNVSNPLLFPEIVGIVVDNVYIIPDLLSYIYVNSIWNIITLKKLYEGSLNDI